MDVTFTKRGTGYLVTIRRDRGPRLAPRGGPGSSATVPHDAAHFVVEAEAGIGGGVFGRLAAANGMDGLFWPDDPDARRKAARSARRPSATLAAQMATSERLASLTTALWEVRAGLREPNPAWPGTPADSGVAPELLERIFRRYDEFSTQWQSLPDGGSLTLVWRDRYRQEDGR